MNLTARKTYKRARDKSVLSESLFLASRDQAPVNSRVLFILCQLEALLLFRFAFLQSR